MRHNVVGGTPSDEVDDIVGAEIFLDGLNGLQDNDQRLAPFHLHLRVETVVAAAAVVFGIGLSEIVEQHLASAY